MKVAIVEDDAVMALLLEEVSRAAGCTVVGIAPTAQSALAMIRRARPDCVLLDFSLRGKRNGLQVLEQAKLGLPSLFAVMITAWDINDIAGRIDAVQPDRILRKPIHTGVLATILARQSRLVGGPSQRAEQPRQRLAWRSFTPAAQLSFAGRRA